MTAQETLDTPATNYTSSYSTLAFIIKVTENTFYLSHDQNQDFYFYSCYYYVLDTVVSSVQQ